MEERNIISYGGGQNSTAMIILMIEKKVKIDEIIFSDTGNEMPKTYEFLKVFEQFCKKNKINFTTVKSHLGSVREYYFENNIIPYRMFRSCSDKFKVRVINKYLKEKYGKDVIINMFIGIGSDEKHRAKIVDKKNIKYFYPLIEYDIDREKCIEIIKKEFKIIPVKSGCYFCPFQPKSEWSKLLKESPELYDLSIEFEKNGRAYPEGSFIGNMTLEDFKKALKEQTKLFPEDCKLIKCVWCHT